MGGFICLSYYVKAFADTESVHKGKINPVMKRLKRKVKMNEKDFLLVMIRVQTSDL